MRLGSQVSNSLCDICITSKSQQADSEVTQTSHDPRAGVGTYLRAVFIESDVSDIMTSVFDTPMSSIKGQ